jgi:hypothetical protein
VTGHEEWQRPPLEPGNTAAESHGAYSEREIEPIVARWEEALQASHDLGELLPHLRGREFVLVSHQLSRLLAKIERVTAWLEANGGELDEHGAPRPAVAALDRWESQLSRALERVGADPMSYAEIRRTLAEGGEVDLDDEIRRLAEGLGLTGAIGRPELILLESKVRSLRLLPDRAAANAKSWWGEDRRTWPLAVRDIVELIEEAEQIRTEGRLPHGYHAPAAANEPGDASGEGDSAVGDLSAENGAGDHADEPEEELPPGPTVSPSIIAATRAAWPGAQPPRVTP